MPQITGFQLSLFGKTSWELFHQATGMIIEPCWHPSQIPKFQCLLLDDGRMPEWCEGEALTSHGVLWTPDIGESPLHRSAGGEYSSWRILTASVPGKYSLSPAACSKILRLATMAGVPPPIEIEYLLKKQGGAYQSSDPFSTDGCGEWQRKKTKRGLRPVSDGQMTLFQHF